jgi:hypothetical protein
VPNEPTRFILQLLLGLGTEADAVGCVTDKTQTTIKKQKPIKTRQRIPLF